MTRAPQYRTLAVPARDQRSKQRQLIAVALLRAISVQGGTNAAAAKWLKVSPRTMYAWVHCRRPITVEKVLACKQLADAFREALCTFDHGHHGASAGYVLKKRRGSK